MLALAPANSQPAPNSARIGSKHDRKIGSFHHPWHKIKERPRSFNSVRRNEAMFSLHHPGAHSAGQKQAHNRHRPGCNSVSCDRWADIGWDRHHRPRPALREAQASWYGPADSGGPLACGGGDLTSSTLGVANKTLPCGMRVRVCLNRSGPCVDVRVVDRGPYVAGRDFDLTEATARAIGFLSRGVGPVWVGVGLQHTSSSG